jgi:long-chain acyl-CoA synthetase
VSRPHDVKGEVPVAFVVRSHGATVTARELQEFFLGRAPAYAHPRDVFFLDAMPLAGTGKTDRQELIRRARRAPAPA